MVGEHAIVISVDSNAFRSGNVARESCLYSPFAIQQQSLTAPSHVHESQSEFTEIIRKFFCLISAHQKASRPNEIGVMVILLFIAKRVHLVGSGGKEKRPRIFLPKEVVSQMANVVRIFLTWFIQEISESLKLVKNDEIGFQCLHAAPGQGLTEFTDQFLSDNSVDIISLLIAGVHNQPKSLEQFRLSLQFFLECNGQPLIQTTTLAS